MGDTLYCFKLNPETGEVVHFSISPEDLEDGKWANYGKYWRFRYQDTYNYCYAKDLDRFKQWKVYSFNPDIKHAIKIIRDTLTDKITKAHKEYNKYTDIYTNLYLWETMRGPEEMENEE